MQVVLGPAPVGIAAQPATLSQRFARAARKRWEQQLNGRASHAAELAVPWSRQFRSLRRQGHGAAYGVSLRRTAGAVHWPSLPKVTSCCADETALGPDKAPD